MLSTHIHSGRLSGPHVILALGRGMLGIPIASWRDGPVLSIIVLWVHLRTPTSMDEVESNGERLRTPALGVHRHLHTHAFTPAHTSAPTHANTLPHIPHTYIYMHRRKIPQTDRLHSTAPLSLLLFCSFSLVHIHPPYPQLFLGFPKSSEDSICWLMGGVGLGSGISWSLYKKLRPRKKIFRDMLAT